MSQKISSEQQNLISTTTTPTKPYPTSKRHHQKNFFIELTTTTSLSILSKTAKSAKDCDDEALIAIVIEIYPTVLQPLLIEIYFLKT
jgi:hypothetical protein